MTDLAFGLLLAGGGGVLAAHCSRMTWLELRTVNAKFAEYPRSAQLVAFAAVIIANALAAILGAFFLMIGLILMMATAR